jgi:DNA-binding NtrC family response regulator
MIMQCEQYTIARSHCKTIKHVLIIEDSVSLANHLKEMIDGYFSFRCDIATTEMQANEMIRRKRYDLIIPSTPNNKYGTLFALKEDG